MASVTKKRITIKHSRPNPLFYAWLQELYDEAKTKKSGLEGMLKEALDSISKYPLPLNTGAECAILKGFGKKLCLFLDQKLEAYNSQNIPNNTASNIKKKKQTNSTDNESNNIEEGSSNAKEKQSISPKKYKPKHRSGGFAIIIALLNHLKENPSSPGLKKEEIFEKAQHHCEESFTRPKPDTFYTAWSNMTRLITKGLVLKNGGRKAEYRLTDEGVALATELERESKDIPSVNNIIFDDTAFTNCNLPPEQNVQQNGSMEDCGMMEMAGGTFDVILLIDKMETSGVSKKNDPTVAQFKKYPNLKHEYRHLKVGDFTWIARSKINTGLEFVLPYIVERKRMDDLGASIKDGRFHEQKFRLRKCGLKNVMYLVESYGSNKHVGLPIQSLMQALVNTRVQDGFKVHMTDSLTNSARFLAMMTKKLSLEYEQKTLKGRSGDVHHNSLMTFEYFNKAASKSKPLTVTEAFIKILLQLKGMSVEKALAITKIYKTPRSLINVYRSCCEKEGEMLLANLKYGDLNRNVGPSVSKSLYQLFTIKNLL